MRIVKIASRQYATGLWWQMFATPGTRRRQGLVVARSTAQSLESSAFNVLAMRKAQFGLGQYAGTGKPPRIRSLASALAGHVPGAWLGSFLLADGCWWVCAVSDGTIVAEGDRICASEDEARQHVVELKALLTFDADVSFDSVAESHAFLLPLLSSGAWILPLYGRQPLPPYAVPISVVCLLLVSWVLWYQESLVLTDRQARMQAAQNQIQSVRSLAANPDSQFPRPWEAEPPAWLAAETCFEFIRTQPVFAAGWELAIIEWTPANVMLTYTHRPGASFTVLPDGARIDPARPTQCRVRQILPLPKAKGPIALVPADTASARLFDVTRQSAAKGSLKFTPPLTKKQGSVTLTATWTTGSWRMSSLPAGTLGTPDVVDQLRQIPGLTMTRIVYANSQITLEGHLYARLQDPSEQ